MISCTCFLLFGAFAYTNSSPVTTLTEDTPEFNVKETSKNDNVATNKTVIGDNNIPEGHSTVETFTDFVQELVIILNTYNDDIFEDFVHIIDIQIKKYRYKSQNELKNLLAEESNLLMRKSVSAKKAVINQIVAMVKLLKIFDTNVRELLDYINSLYRDDAKIKFRQILTDLKGYSAGYGNSRTKHNFTRLIRECVRATVFIHTNLNTNVKRKLKKYIDTFMKKIKEFRSSSSTTNFTNFKPTVSKSFTYTVKISENTSTEDKTTKPSLKLNPTKTTAHIQEENKRIFRTNTSEEKRENATIAVKTTKRNESNSQQTNITQSTNETVTQVMFYMTTEKPAIVYKSESRSQLVEKMLKKISTEKQATNQSTTTSEKRLTSKKYLRRIGALPLLGEVVTVEIFDRDRRRSKKSHTRTSKFTPSPELKDYLKIMQQLQTEVDRLKKINDINYNSIKPNKDLENNGIDEHEPKDKPSNKRKDRKNFKRSKHSYEHEENVHREKNKIDDTEEDLKKTNVVSKDRDTLGRSAEIVEDDIHYHLPSLRNHSHKLIHKEKDTKSKSNKTTKEAKTSIEPNKHKSKKLVLRSFDPLSTASKSKKTTKEAETFTEPNKHKSKKLALRSFEPLSTESKSQKTTKKAETSIEPNKDTSQKLVLSSFEPLSTASKSKKTTKEAETSIELDKHKSKQLALGSFEPLSTASKSKKTTKEAETSIEPDKHKSKELALRSFEPLSTASKSKKTTKEAETSIVPDKHKSKQLVLSSFQPLSTAKDNAANIKLAKTILKSTKKVDNTALKVSEEIKQSRIDEKTTKGISKVTENNINETTTTHSLRRLVEAFPSLFEGNTLKQGLYPAHLWD